MYMLHIIYIDVYDIYIYIILCPGLTRALSFIVLRKNIYPNVQLQT